MSDTIIVTMDRAGRLVVPKAIRERSGFEPGTPLVIRYRDGRIEIEPPPRDVRIRRRGKVLVAVPVDEREEVLTAAAVRETLGLLRGGQD
jgi:AbrB family looped-hinge helix DNA binding protein